MQKCGKKFNEIICQFKKKCYLCIANAKNAFSTLKFCENSSVGRAQPCQGWGRGFESRFSLEYIYLLMHLLIS